MERYVHILIGVLAIAGVVVAVVKRPIAPKITRWLLAHQSQVESVAPFVFMGWSDLGDSDPQKRLQQHVRYGWGERHYTDRSILLLQTRLRSMSV